MNHWRIAVLIMAALSVAGAQATFEPQAPGWGAPTFPVPKGAVGDPEGVSWNGLGASGIDIDNGCGFPCGGAQYLRMIANGPESIPLCPPGGVPAFTTANEVYIPIPSGATVVSLCWDFYNAEGGQTATFNDGMQIDVIDLSCVQLSVLAYADTSKPLGPCVDNFMALCPSFAPEILPAGANTISGAPLPAGAAFIRVAVWNGGDNAVSSHGVVDEVSFVPPCVLTITGMNTAVGYQIDVKNLNCPPGVSYFTCFTTNLGAFPTGYWFGIEPTLSELASQITTPVPPFNGVLDAAGNSCFTVVIPGIAGPLGIPIYAVTVFHIGGIPIGSTPPICVII